ncbi:alcohol dehydrogenase catalytic domain-containing protein [bacterium]|nr:alcohol dehydrogenase catalytic domain-containing protein [bacterium]
MYYSVADVRTETQPTPRAGAGELLVRIHASGVCGSDVMEWYRRHKAPLVLGHEVAGEVVEVGKGVTRFGIGDRVVVAHHVPCMACRYCMSGHETVCDTLRSTNFAPGGFCEFVRVPEINVRFGTFPIPGGVSFEQATFAEPVACVLRAQRIAGVAPGRRVLVIGSGISGLLHIQVARAAGAGRIIATDILPSRLDAATRFGATVAINAKDLAPDTLRAANDGRLADIVITTAGAPAAIEQALACVDRGGTVLFFAPASPDHAVPLRFNDVFWRTDVTLTTSYAGAPADHATALELIAESRIDVASMITHRLPLAKTQEAFGLVAKGTDSIKVIVEPQA